MRSGRMKLGLCLAVLAAAGFGALALGRASRPPAFDHRPVTRASALERWTPPWPAGVAGAALEEPARKWIVMGWDGASWDIALPLLEAGRLPHLARLMREGSYGDLSTFKPAESAAVWTTVATGVSPGRHGILGFTRPATGARAWLPGFLSRGPLRPGLYSNADRRRKALWNIASDAGRRVMVVGYHNTFPAEKVSGLLLSNYLVRQQMLDALSATAGRTVEPGAERHLVYPPEAIHDILPLARRVEDMGWDEARRFAALDEERFRGLMRGYAGLARREAGWVFRTLRIRRETPLSDLLWSYLCRGYAIDTFHGRVALRLFPDLQPDFVLLHFQSPDWAGHHFLYFHSPERFASLPGAEERRRELDPWLPVYRGTLAAFYEYADEWLGKLMELRQGPMGVMVVSDHGMDVHETARQSGFHDLAPPGILVLSGPGIRRGQRLEGATVYDILPTILASAGLPMARDQEGRILREAFGDASLREDRLVWMDTYGGGAHPTSTVEMAPELRESLDEELRGLGYIQ